MYFEAHLDKFSYNLVTLDILTSGVVEPEPERCTGTFVYISSAFPHDLGRK